MYPLFHPERQYFVNLAYFYERIYQHVTQKAEKYFGEIRLSFVDYYCTDQYITSIMNLNYIKYEKKFGAEQNLPGFLMTNQQLLQMIRYQSKCKKYQNGYNDIVYSPIKSIFNCLVYVERDNYGMLMKKCMKREEYKV